VTVGSEVKGTSQIADARIDWRVATSVFELVEEAVRAESPGKGQVCFFV